MIYGDANSPVINIATPIDKQSEFVLTDEEVAKIANWALIIEQHYQQPMDIEWAKDGVTNEIFIIQARPETVHSQHNPLLFKQYKLLGKGEPITRGQAIGARITTGIARIISSPRDADKLKSGEILVTDLTSPDWDPVLKNTGAHRKRNSFHSTLLRQLSDHNA